MIGVSLSVLCYVDVFVSIRCDNNDGVKRDFFEDSCENMCKL